MAISYNREFDRRFKGAAVISRNYRPCSLPENMERLRDHDIDICEPRPITLMSGSVATMGWNFSMSRLAKFFPKDKHVWKGHHVFRPDASDPAPIWRLTKSKATRNCKLWETPWPKARLPMATFVFPHDVALYASHHARRLLRGCGRSTDRQCDV